MIPCVDPLKIIREGFQFLRGVVMDLQLNNLMMIATTVSLGRQLVLCGALCAGITLDGFAVCAGDKDQRHHSRMIGEVIIGGEQEAPKRAQLLG